MVDRAKERKKEDPFNLQSPVFSEDGEATEGAFRDLGTTLWSNFLILLPNRRTAIGAAVAKGSGSAILETECRFATIAMDDLM